MPSLGGCYMWPGKVFVQLMVFFSLSRRFDWVHIQTEPEMNVCDSIYLKTPAVRKELWVISCKNCISASATIPFSKLLLFLDLLLSSRAYQTWECLNWPDLFSFSQTPFRWRAFASVDCNGKQPSTVCFCPLTSVIIRCTCTVWHFGWTY